MFRITVAGHLCVDLVPKLSATARLAPGQLIQIGPMDARLGGAVANTGLDLLDLGANATLHAVLGDDALSVLLEHLLGGRAEAVRMVGETTSYSVVLEVGGADRTFWHHTGVNAKFDPALVGVDTDMLHLAYPPLLPGTLVDGAAPLCGLLARAKDAGATTSVDLAVVDPDSEIGSLDWPRILDRLLAVTDVISPSTDDLASMLGTADEPTLGLAEELCGYLLDRGAAVALVTAGAQGMVLRTANLERIQRGGRVLAALGHEWDSVTMRMPVEASVGHATSTGAGDAATAGLLHALAQGLGPQQAVDLAGTTSATIMAGKRPTPGLVCAQTTDQAVAP